MIELASFQGVLDRAAMGAEPRLDIAPVLLGDVADLEQAVDEQPQAQ